MTTKERPIHSVKLGLIEAAIWRNETEGKPRFNVTVRRLYSVEEEGQRKWRSTDSFGRDDLLVAAKVLDLAHTWICEQAGTKPETEHAA
jgi:hypothetical protein